MIRSLMRLSPLEDRHEEELLAEFNAVSRAVVLATLLSALVQGLLAAPAYYLAGFEAVFLLTALTILLALVPFVGAAAVWFPACLWLAFVEQRFIAALVLLVYGMVVISMSDNVVKPYVLAGRQPARGAALRSRLVRVGDPSDSPSQRHEPGHPGPDQPDRGGQRRPALQAADPHALRRDVRARAAGSVHTLEAVRTRGDEASRTEGRR